MLNTWFLYTCNVQHFALLRIKAYPTSTQSQWKKLLSYKLLLLKPRQLSQKSGYVTDCEISILYRRDTPHCHLATSDTYAASYLMHIEGFHPQVKKEMGVKFTPYIHLQPRLKISGVIHPPAYLIRLHVVVLKQAGNYLTVMHSELTVYINQSINTKILIKWQLSILFHFMIRIVVFID